MRNVLYTITSVLIVALMWGCSPTDSPTVHRISTNVTPEEGGTINPSSGEFEAGTEVEVTANPSGNFIFEEWRGDLTGSHNPTTFTIESDKTITAVFRLKEYPLTVEIDGEGNVSEEVVEEKSKDYEHGTVVRLTAEPAENWVFDSWEGDLSGSESSETITVDSEKNVTAVFKPKEYSLTTNVEGEGSVTEEVVEEKAKDYKHGTTVRLTAEPGENWEFSNWEGDLSGTENPETVTVENEMNVTAVFKMKEYALDLTINGEGEIIAEPDQTSYQHGEEVSLTADPAEVWRFDQWEGDITGSDTTVSFTVEQNMSITATFVRIENPLFGMGYNHNGQVGGNNLQETDPVLIEYEIDRVATGDWHSLFIDQEGTLWGLGYNFYGQLGDGTTTDRHVPVQIASDVIEVSGGEHHTLFVTSDGILWAVGENESGQLGDGTTTNRIDPVQIDSNVESIAAGQRHSVYVKSDGTLWAMGENTDGQLGDGTNTNRHSPVHVASGVAEVSAGGRHTLYTDSDGTLWAAGGNGSGQLGDGTRASRNLPVEIDTNVNEVAAGRDHSLYIKNDNVLWGMGNNAKGQLGDGSTENKYDPIQITEGISTVAAGIRHTLYVETDGTMWAVGNNSDGQLGDGTTEDRSEPVQIDTKVVDVAAGVHHSLFLKE